MNKTFEKIYSENNAILNKDEALNENTALFEKVYAEAEMLNEMNPKLRALLAAGLIGTAGLGATSCSTPEDPYEDPAAIEQLAPETPGSTTEETGTTETPETPTETEDTKETAALSGFKALGVEDYVENLTRAIKDPKLYDVLYGSSKFASYRYENKEYGFVPVKFDGSNQYKDGQTYIRYRDASTKELFYVPVDMVEAFDNARKA